MSDSESDAFERRRTPYPAVEPPTLDGMAAIERRLRERLLYLTSGTQEIQETLGHLHFWVGGRQYSTALSGLREALTALPAVSPLPFSPPWLLGLFPLRSDFVALLDLRALLGATGGTGEADDPDLAYIKQALLVGDDERPLAFGVDRIGQIADRREPRANAGAAPKVPGQAARYVEGYFPPDAPDSGGAIALNLVKLYGDVIAQLEEWSHHV